MLDINMKKIVEQMAEEGRPMVNLAELFIKEPLSLEVLLMLEDESPMTIEQISEMAGNAKITDILDELKGFKTIDIKDNLVNITDRGQCIVIKLIRCDKMPNITAKKIEEISSIIDDVLKKYGLEIDETIVSESLIEIKIIPVIIRKPRKKITMPSTKHR